MEDQAIYFECHLLKIKHASSGFISIHGNYTQSSNKVKIESEVQK